MEILGIDIGGAALKGAPVDISTGKLLAERFSIATPRPATPRRVAKAVAEIARHFKWRGRIGVGFPGVVVNQRTMNAINLHPSWGDVDSAKLFSQSARCRVSVINDTDAAGLAEMQFGAGRQCQGAVLIITAGTGIGTALFCRKQLFPNAELGHLTWKGKDAETLVAASVRTKEKLSLKEWAQRLDGYLRELERLFSPELIIIGGGVSERHKEWFKYLRLRAPVVPAKLLNSAGIVGAALAAK